MIRGPVLPLTREGLRHLLHQRWDLVEHGLTPVAEDLELGAAGVGLVDVLLRDAAGAPVLALCTETGDGALLARVLAAHDFWQRNADAMPKALPEARLRPGASCRMLVIGTAIPPQVREVLRRLQLGHLDLIEVEQFLIGGLERIVVRSDLARGRSAPEPIDGGVGDDPRRRLELLGELLGRLDARMVVDGDRFSRRVSHRGHALCSYWFADGEVHGVLAGATPCRLLSDRDVRVFVDQVARRYLELPDAAPSSAPPPPATGTVPVRSGGFDALWQTLSQTRLSREEFSALGDLAGEDPPYSG